MAPLTPDERIAAAQARAQQREAEERDALQKALKAKQAKLRKLTRALGQMPRSKK